MKNINLFIDFIEKPVTKEELEIAEVLKSMLAAVHTKKFEILHSIYLPNAIIMDTASNPFGSQKKRGDEHISILTKVLADSPPIYFKDVSIRVTNDNEATVYLSCTVPQSKSLQKLVNRYFKFIKHTDQWRIIEVGNW